jgi:selenocysteine lyase/cysteine desulfurase
MHEYNGYCFVDFAASAPYIKIDMHPENENEYLDAIFFSPHKFLGGPGTSGVLIFNSKLYHNNIPDNPGGGTVEWTNPWGEHKFVDNIEAREDGGTPPFLQTIRIALAINLKEEMGIDNMAAREKEINSIIWSELDGIKNLHILASECKKRLPIFSFYIDGLHYNLAVKILNDRFGIQTRGGCSCAGTYGHILLNVDIDVSKMITEKINHGDRSDKPGWIRASFHPLMTDDEILYITKSIKQLSENYDEWAEDYLYNNVTNNFHHKNELEIERKLVESWLSKG